MTDMRKVIETEDVLADLLKLLKEKKPVMTTKETAILALHELYLKVKQDYDNGISSNSMSRDNQTKLIRIMNLLQQEAALVQKSLSDAPFDVIRRNFNTLVSSFQNAAQQVSEHTLPICSASGMKSSLTVRN